ncbi:CARDB domain-containing protein [Halalkalicoccus subterraneus]|uniref:CARDB domain-containing protein n=1 Tax=Halalkalicoccus subterraneus TaxID=2675002 RepID=UPI001FEA7088|nr:CARDB domain-containing protein [Halalkalicoccus subterraneus]
MDTDRNGARTGEERDGRHESRGGSSGIDSDRRRFIRLGGATAVALAGCTDAGSEPNATVGGPAITIREATVSDESITTDDELEIVGTLENDGDERGTYHVELRVDDVIVETEAVSVDPGARDQVTFSGSFSSPGEYEVRLNDVHAGTVEVELPPPEFELVGTTVEETRVAVGEAVAVEATVANVGGREGSITIELQVDGRPNDTEELTIAAGAEESVRFTPTFESPGSYDLAINGIAVDTVVVDRPAAFEIVGTELELETVAVGETVAVRAHIENVGGRTGTVTATLRADGETVDTREGPIEPGEVVPARFSVGFDDRGARTLRVVATGRDPAAGPGGNDDARVGRLYVLGCSTVVSETVTVGNRSSQTYEFDLNARAEVTVATATRSGVDPTLSVVGPPGAMVEGVSGGEIRRSVTIPQSGRYEIRLGNDSYLPWQDGRWAIEIEVCTWAD